MYEVYTVKLGDTLEDILRKFNIKKDELVNLNGIIDLNNLSVGMQILVPRVDSNPYRYYTVKKGDSIREIANKYNLDYNLLLILNGLEENDYIYPNQTLMLPAYGVSLYITKDNDTIESISNDLGMSVVELLENNNNIYLRENQIIVFWRT